MQKRRGEFLEFKLKTNQDWSQNMFEFIIVLNEIFRVLLSCQ